MRRSERSPASRSSTSETCQSCARSKVRCIRDAENLQACQRCLRLGRECIKRQTGRRFHGFQKDRRIEELESKVRELTSNHATTTDNSTSESTFTVATLKDLASDGSDDVIDQGFLDLNMAEDYLITFKNVLAPNFPFVVVSPQTSASKLRLEKPFLFLAILASSSFNNLTLQRSLGAQVKNVVGSRVVIKGEVTFDLLQGLLVYLAWSHYHTKPQLYTQYLQLAISLVIELRLDRPPTTKTWKTPLRFAPKYDLNEQTVTRPTWGNDEKRAVIGCYYLSSTISVILQKYSSFPYISYIEECLQSLRDAGEYPHDKTIDQLVQLQQITEKIDRFSTSNGTEPIKPGSGSELLLASIKSDLQNFHKRLPPDFENTPFLAIHFYSTSLSLYQLSLSVFDRRHEKSSSTSELHFDEMSCATINSAEAMLGLCISLPAGREVGFTNTQWVQMAFAMLIAYRHTAASTSQSQAMRFLSTLSQLRQRLEALSTLDVDMNGDRDVFFDFKNRVTRIESRLIGTSRKGDSGDHKTTYHETVARDGPHEAMYSDNLEGLDPFQNFVPNAGMEYAMPDDYLFSASLDQIMSSWL